MFHETLRNILSGIPGVFHIHDDIFVFGKDGAHDIALEATDVVDVDFKPYIPIDFKPYIPIDFKPYIPIDFKPYIPIDFKPYIPVDFKPYIPIDFKPYIPIDFKPYISIWNELSVVDDILLRGSRIIIPTSLRKKIGKIGHEGDLGIVKTKGLLRTCVWFPKLDLYVEEEIKSCIPTVNQPLPSPLPSRPWEKVKCDFFGPIPSGEYLCVVIDEYTRFPIVEVVRSTASNTIIPIIDKIFSTFGIPDILTSDNVPPFNGHDIRST